MFNLRPAQQQVFNYTGGKMGVSAVPGSGKTYTLSCLGAKLIGEGYLRDDQEVLVVTLVNSAVNNFETRIAGFLKDEYGLLPRVGYRVRTLHGLSHDIVKERPDLCGLANNFQILDQSITTEIIKSTAQAWLRAHPEFKDEWGNPETPLSPDRGGREWEDLVVEIATAFIRQSKDLQLTPAQVRELLDGLRETQPLLEMGYEMYRDYQRSLSYRGGVDFDDLIRLALRALNSDAELLQMLRYRWPFILEDEAQDSSRLQEQILRLLTGDDGNWVRVGDPNQAIYETFTTANPRYLKEFMAEPGVSSVPLPNSGRSTRSIIELANYLIDWTQGYHPVDPLRQALSLPHIREVAKNDLRPNPPDQPDGIHLMTTKYDPDKEIYDVVRSVQRWLTDHADQTVAILVPRNTRGRKFADALREKGIPVVELLNNSLPTREVARILADVLRYLDDPTSKSKLLDLFKDLYKKELAEADSSRLYLAAGNKLKSCPRLEDFLRVRGNDWLESLRGTDSDQVFSLLDHFRMIINRWQDASLLPVDQLLLTLAQDLFTDPAGLALAHKLALVMEQDARAHPDWHIPQFANQLDLICKNQRKLMGFSDEDAGFDPEKHAGKVVVATIHKAKGLEWDRVYLVSANNYDFPSGQPYEKYISEKWFLRDRLNLQAEVLARLKALVEDDPFGLYLPYGLATEESRLGYSAERLRLLYVGITRARRELIVTWNMGTYGDCQPSMPFIALQTYWEANHAGSI